MVGSRMGAEVEATFLDSLRNGVFHLEAVTHEDLTRMAMLVRTYGKQKLGSADASVVAMAERLSVPRVATLNHKDFRQVPLRDGQLLDLLPYEHQLARHRS